VNVNQLAGEMSHNSINLFLKFYLKC